VSGSPRRGVLRLLLFAAACLVGTGLWWLHGELDAQVRLSRAAPPRAGTSPLAAWPPAQQADAVRASQTIPQVSTDVSTPGPTPSRAAGPNEFPICGDQPLARDRLERLYAGGKEWLPLRPDLLAVAQALAGGDDLARGVAILLEAEISDHGVGFDERQRAAIVELALASRDADLWLLAWRLCGYGKSGVSDACGRIDMPGWVERDPGNGAPWLWLAQREAEAGNTQGVDEAMYRLSQSRFVDPRWHGLMRVQSHPALAPERGLPALLASVWLTGLQVATATPSYRVLTTYCAPGALLQANRRLRCDDIATVMTTSGRTQMDLMFGHLVARHLGWHAERLQVLQDFRDAARLPEVAMGDGRRSFDFMADLSSCEARRAWIDWMGELGLHGETEVLRRRIAASGMTLAQAGAKGRAQQAAWAASAPQSASSSPARP